MLQKRLYFSLDEFMSSRKERECNDNAPLQDNLYVTPFVTLCYTLGVPSILEVLKLCDYILIKRKKSRSKFCGFLLNCVVT